MAESIIVEIRRYQPEQSEEPTWESFEVPYNEEWTVLDGLNYIKDQLDGSLSYRWSCKMGVCGSCGMVVNGEPVLTCATYLTQLSSPVRVEPLQGFPVIRDLVGDIQDFTNKLKSVKPWIVNEEEPSLEEGEYLQTPEQLAEYKQYSMCINCMLCYSACPVMGSEPEFVGPAALALGHRYNLDNRDQGTSQRMDRMMEHEAVWGCTFVGECSTVCPKNVDPAGAIQQAKAASAQQYFKKFFVPKGAGK